MLADHQIPYGLQGEHCIHISEVPLSKRGLRCECVCPACGHPLVARMGEKNRHYFAHHRHSDCQNAAETGIHLRAKAIIQHRKLFYLPEKEVTVNRRHLHSRVSASSLLVEKGTLVSFDSVVIEQPEKGFQPDVTGYASGRTLFIEVCVTHAVDSLKLEKIKSSAVSCVEIDLSRIDRFSTPAQIEEAINDTANSAWVYHAKEAETANALHAGLESEYQALVAKHNELLAKERRAHERNEGFKTALKDMGGWLTHRLLHHDIIPEHLAPSGSRHLVFHSYDDKSNAAFFECHTSRQNHREMVSIVWAYKNASRHTHRNARSKKIPYCTINIAPLIAQHKPPHKPIQESAIDAFFSHTVIGALNNLSGWHIAPYWLREQRQHQLEIYRQQEVRRIAAEKEAREARAKVQHRQYLQQLSQKLRDDVDCISTLVNQCRRRANDIEKARSRDDISVISRWETVSESGNLSREAFKHLDPETLDGSLRVLSFPYCHEWAFSEHPDLVKAQVVDKLIGKSMNQSEISIREIESIYLTVVSGLKAEGWPGNLWGASSLAIQAHHTIKSMMTKRLEYRSSAADMDNGIEVLALLTRGLEFFEEPDGSLIYPSGPETKFGFISLLCEDMQRIGVLSAIPQHNQGGVQRYELSRTLD